MPIKNIAEVFTFKLDEEDEEKLALARKGAKAFAGLNGRITALKATGNYKYLTLREAALRYHSFIDPKADFFDPQLRFYVMTFPPTSLEVAALRKMQNLHAPDPVRQAITLIASLLPQTPQGGNAR